jgi:hypothetical protein
VVSAILYPLLILFLALLMGLLSMNSTRKNILDNMKLEISDNLFDSVTCDCTFINNTLKNHTSAINDNKQEITNMSETIEELQKEIETLKNNQRIILKVGDYVYMRPASVSYTIAAEDTGCTSTSYCGGYTDQTINPNELTLWRVIRVNADGTYDVVSVYASSTEVEFYGATGYKKFVGTLNKIAEQYTGKYVVKTRMMGYEETTDTDIDTELVKNSLGKLVANKVGTTTATAYWLASQYEFICQPGVGVYCLANSTDYIRYITLNGDVEGAQLSRYEGAVQNVFGHSAALRPIVTLSSVVFATGSGTSSSPYVLK